VIAQTVIPNWMAFFIALVTMSRFKGGECMLFIRFTDVPKDGFPNYERLPYEEALLLSTQVHQEAQQANECFSSEFRIFDDADQLVYKGSLQFGDPTYPNLYLQLKDRIPRIRIRKENANEEDLVARELGTFDTGFLQDNDGVSDSATAEYDTCLSLTSRTTSSRLRH